MSISHKFGILTVSDRCHKGETVDKSGPELENMINVNQLLKGQVVVRDCVPDEKELIKSVLINWTDNKNLDVILTTGGTGFTPRDVTPEATQEVIHRHTPGITVAITVHSLSKTPYAMLSRLISGIRNNTLIVNLPGSVKGATECLEAFINTIPHAVAQLKNRTQSVAEQHNVIHSDHKLVEEHMPQLHSCHHKCGHSNVDVSRVAGRARESPYPMVDVKHAQNIIMQNLPPSGIRVINTAEAMGFVLSEAVAAKNGFPPFDASIKDGYAVIAEDKSGPRTVIGRSVAGTGPGLMNVVQRGQCMRINTGAPIPPGANAVVQVEDSKLLKATEDSTEELEIEILVAPEVGLDIRPAGSDIKPYQIVLPEKSVLGPSELGLLATIGTSSVHVHSKPLTTIISTGDELQKANEALSEGYIYDSNKIMLMSLLKEHGFPAADGGIARDNPDSMLSQIKKALSTSDLLVTTGSVSMGERDILKQVLLQDLDATIHFGRVFMKPGKPTTFATLLFDGKQKMVFGLPGNPVSALVTSHLFVLPALRKLSGFQNPFGLTLKAQIKDDIKLDDRPDYQRACLVYNENNPIPTASITGKQISSRLLSCASANALVMLPPKSESKLIMKAEELVDALVLSRL